QTMLAARAGEAAKVIEGTAEPAALPASEASIRAGLEPGQAEPIDEASRHRGRPAGTQAEEPRGANARERVRSRTGRGASVLSGIADCQSIQKSLKRSGAISVYLTVC